MRTDPRHPPPNARPESRQGLLCICQSFAPETTPTAIRSSSLLAQLSAQWDITVVTESGGPRDCDGRVRVEVVASRRPARLLATLARLRLGKLQELVVWPDESIFWLIPTIRAARRLAKQRRPSAIVVFMMPYSAGLAGIALRRLTGLPLILNLDDSPTCTDMHPAFPTRLHFHLARALEDRYARSADAIVYVSQTNLEAVKARQRERDRAKLHLVRYGADGDARRSPPARGEDFEIAYVGAMSGWWSLIEDEAAPGRLKRLYRGWTQLGRYERMTLDQRTSSPAVVGQAILDTLAEHADWRGRVKLNVYGNPYAPEIVARALAAAGVEDVVTVSGLFAHSDVARILDRADLLMITLPKRVDGSRGGRISAKTYEYLTTDRPILAAVPRGESWDYLADKPGVWLVEPDDRERIAAVIAELAAAKFAGHALAFDRSELREQLSYETRAREFALALSDGIERSRRCSTRDAEQVAPTGEQ